MDQIRFPEPRNMALLYLALRFLFGGLTLGSWARAQAAKQSKTDEAEIQLVFIEIVIGQNSLRCNLLKSLGGSQRKDFCVQQAGLGFAVGLSRSARPEDNRYGE